jgi:tetratricopeptide (TPR) repeat protein
MESIFADVLNKYIVRSSYTYGQLAKRSNLPKTTIINWANGIVTKPRRVGEVLSLAQALNMNAEETNDLLQSIGQAPIAVLLKKAKEHADVELINQLAPWIQKSTGSISLNISKGLIPEYSVSIDKPLPQGSRTPLRSNPFFVGRVQELNFLVENLLVLPKATNETTIAICGMGGVGKTQLVNEFLHRYGCNFAGGVFWLSFADQSTIPNEVAACGGNEGLALRFDYETLSLEMQVQLVQRAWREPIPRLLIFDNCEDVVLLNKWRPPHGGCQVIITARNSRWDPSLGLKQLILREFKSDESIYLLQKYSPSLSKKSAANIAVELGDLPLALHLAGHYLAFQQTLDPTQYLNQLQQLRLAHPSLQGIGATHSPTNHELHISRTFAVSYQQLEDTPHLKLVVNKLLARISYLAPGVPIPEELLRLMHSDIDSGSYFKALQLLLTLGFILQTNKAFVVHRLIVEFFRETIHDETAKLVIENAITQEIEHLIQTKDRSLIRTWQNHLRYLLVNPSSSEDEHIASLHLIFGEAMMMIGNFAESEKSLRKCIFLYKKTLGTSHPSCGRALNKLGRVLQETAQRNEAQVCYEQALEIQRDFYGYHHIETTRTLSNLASILAEKANWDEAHNAIQLLIEIQLQTVGEHHIDTAESFDMLGSLFEQMGRLQESKVYLEKALSIREAILKPDHPDIGRSYNSIALLHWASEDLVSAQGYWEKGLANLQKSLGEDHPYVATIHNNLGALHHELGNKKEARFHHEQALKIRLAKLGENHTDTGQSYSWLSRFIHEDGDVDAARDYLQKCHSIFVATLGPEHPRTLSIKKRWDEFIKKDI